VLKSGGTEKLKVPPLLHLGLGIGYSIYELGGFDEAG
jgi:hypothetical protein